MDGGASGLALSRTVRTDGAADRFRSLMDSYLDTAYRRAAVLLGDRFEAEDAVHDAAIRAWRHWGQLRDDEHFEAWFSRVLVNVCRDRLSRRRRITAMEAITLRAEPGVVAVDDGSRLVGEQDRLRRLIATLDPDERVAVALRYEADLTVPAIAKLLGVPEGTVKSRLHRALSRLREAAGEAERA